MANQQSDPSSEAGEDNLSIKVQNKAGLSAACIRECHVCSFIKGDGACIAPISVPRILLLPADVKCHSTWHAEPL